MVTMATNAHLRDLARYSMNDMFLVTLTKKRINMNIAGSKSVHKEEKFILGLTIVYL